MCGIDLDLTTCLLPFLLIDIDLSLVYALFLYYSLLSFLLNLINKWKLNEDIGQCLWLGMLFYDTVYGWMWNHGVDGLCTGKRYLLWMDYMLVFHMDWHDDGLLVWFMDIMMDVSYIWM